jgi:hypothetical protein
MPSSSRLRTFFGSNLVAVQYSSQRQATLLLAIQWDKGRPTNGISTTRVTTFYTAALEVSGVAVRRDRDFCLVSRSIQDHMESLSRFGWLKILAELEEFVVTDDIVVFALSVPKVQTF